MKHNKIFHPDFLIIPYDLMINPNIEPMDEKVYSIIYWFEHMKDGICTASNETIASIINPTYPQPRTVQNSLNKLEKEGYILRVYKDAQRRNRTKIISLIAFRRANGLAQGGISSELLVIDERTVGDRHERTVGDQIKNTNKEKNKEYTHTSDFDIFWNLYPKKVDKKKTMDKWSKLPIDIKKIVLEDLPKRVLCQKWLKDGGRFVENPTTYLNGERWNDELVAGRIEAPARVDKI